MTFPENLSDLIFFRDFESTVIDHLAELAEQENWDYQNMANSDGKNKPILQNYLIYTYRKLAQENKITISNDGQNLTFNTGLVTSNQEPIFAFCSVNRGINNPKNIPWYFIAWKRKGEHDMTKFQFLPEMAHYFDNPAELVFDSRKELLTNIEHIIEDNRDRFPEKFQNMSNYALNNFLKGAIDSAKERVKRNYKTAIPQYYQNKIQLLLPLCLSSPSTADLALVVEDHGSVYRAATCLTLDMAYNNARQLVRPDTDWLAP